MPRLKQVRGRMEALSTRNLASTLMHTLWRPLLVAMLWWERLEAAAKGWTVRLLFDGEECPAPPKKGRGAGLLRNLASTLMHSRGHHLPRHR